MNTSTHRPSRLTWFLLAGFLLLGSIGLFAAEKDSPSSLAPSCLTPLSATDSSSSAAEVQALLPVIPIEPASSSRAASLPPGVAPVLVGPLPGEAPSIPDGFKNLYGYKGPYYNTTKLDGQVVILKQTLYSWPSSTWKMTGMVRNQTRCAVTVSNISAKLLGANGEFLGTATATVPVATLRAGEPGPFTIKAPVAASAVKSINWHVDFQFSAAPPRQFGFIIAQAGTAPDGSSYTIDGTVTNAASITASSTQVVAAWLDEQNRVLYVGAATMNPYDTPSDAVDLASRSSAGFLYSTNDPALASLLEGAWDFAIWGTSR